jgi:uncharacterized protein (DUF697 family)
MTSPVQRTPQSLTTPRDRLGAGRIGTYAALGAVAVALPLPILPEIIAQRVRGALVYDLTARYGLSVTPDARKVLIARSAMVGPKGFAGSALRFATGRVLSRLGPLTFLPLVQSALYTFALGHLLHRYLDGARESRAARIDILEARHLRHAIDEAIVGSLRTEARGEDVDFGQPEELRDQITKVVDGAIAVVAGLPSWLVRRLEAAFDEALAKQP